MKINNTIARIPKGSKISMSICLVTPYLIHGVKLLLEFNFILYVNVWMSNIKRISSLSHNLVFMFLPLFILFEITFKEKDILQ